MQQGRREKGICVCAPSLNTVYLGVYVLKESKLEYVKRSIPIYRYSYLGKRLIINNHHCHHPPPESNVRLPASVAVEALQLAELYTKRPSARFLGWHSEAAQNLKGSLRQGEIASTSVPHVPPKELLGLRGKVPESTQFHK